MSTETRTPPLPYVDEHATVVEATPDRSWAALLRVVDGSLSSTASAAFARLLGCVDVNASGPRPLAAGSAMPGFHVTAVEEPRELGLSGRHRFSAYALIFRLDDLGDGRTRLRAETRAVFPGVKGRAYRAMVIGSRAHVLVVRRLLGAAKRRAARRCGRQTASTVPGSPPR